MLGFGHNERFWMPNTATDVIFTYLEQFITSSSRVQQQTLVTNLSTAGNFQDLINSVGNKGTFGSKKVPSGCPGSVDFLIRQVTFNPFTARVFDEVL